MPENIQPLSESSQQWLMQLPDSQKDRELLQKACFFVENHLDNEPWQFFNSSLDKGLKMASILLGLNCDTQTLAAAIIYPCIYHNNISQETIQKQLGKAINKLLVGTQRMQAIHAQTQVLSDNLRKMLLAMVDDIRVVLIQLAERLAVLKKLKNMPREQQIEIAEQALQIYAPLANCLGIGQLKWQLEDLSFRYLQPEQYNDLSKALNMRRTEREQLIDNVKSLLNGLFTQANIQSFEISGRAKHIFSIHRKIERKKVDFSEIYDALALRILVPSIEDCYTALSLVHAEWNPIAKEFDDYIAKPKPNGYRSIHTAVAGPADKNIEIQIRTFKMHEESELGVAAHWKYKEQGSDSQAHSSYEQKINLLRKVLDWQQDIQAEVEDDTDTQTHEQIMQDRVYVFSPQGDIYDLKNGATPLDFAYHVHTELGHRCRGANVNGKLVPLTYSLQTGDRVSITTAKTGEPSRDWLNSHLGYLKTIQAINKVRHFFKKQNSEQNLQAGTEIWEKNAHREGFKRADISSIMGKFNYKKIEDVMIAIGSGDITINGVLSALRNQQTPKEPAQETPEESVKIGKNNLSKSKQSASDLLVDGVDDVLTQLAGCCKPIPGDDIIGYITTGKGVSIHQANCPNIQQAKQRRPEKIIHANWGTRKPQAYPVGIMMTVDNRNGLIRDISALLNNQKIPINGLSTHVNKKNNTAQIDLTIEINSLEPLQQIINQLQQVNGVIAVKRQ